MPNQFKDKYQDSLLLKVDEIKAIFPESLENHSKSYFRDFHINKIKDFVPFVGTKVMPYRKAVTDFMVLTKGSSIRTKGLNSYTLTENTLFFVPAYQIRTSEFMSDDADGYFCHFNINIFNKHLFPLETLNNFPFLQYIGNPLIKLPKDEMGSIVTLMEQLMVEYNHENLPDFNVVSSIFMTLFHKLNRFVEHGQKAQSKAALLTQRYKDALMEHVYDKHTVIEYADLLKVSQNHLNRSVKKTIGKTPLHLLSEIQIIEAKSLLKQSELNISEIAFKLGNKNHSDFSRFFKKHTGITPKKFRLGDF